MNRNYILSVISDFADEYLKEPRSRLPKGCFEKRSYQRWAVSEILRSIEETPSVPPVLTIEEFMKKMKRFSTKKPRHGFIFSTAYDVAADILDVLSAMK